MATPRAQIALKDPRSHLYHWFETQHPWYTNGRQRVRSKEKKNKEPSLIIWGSTLLTLYQAAILRIPAFERDPSLENRKPCLFYLHWRAFKHKELLFCVCSSWNFSPCPAGVFFFFQCFCRFVKNLFWEVNHVHRWTFFFRNFQNMFMVC